MKTCKSSSRYQLSLIVVAAGLREIKSTILACVPIFLSFFSSSIAWLLLAVLVNHARYHGVPDFVAFSCPLLCSANRRSRLLLIQR